MNSSENVSAAFVDIRERCGQQMVGVILLSQLLTGHYRRPLLRGTNTPHHMKHTANPTENN